MKCPLLVSIFTHKGLKTQHTDTDCLKEECAWWDNGDECCAILGLEEYIKVISINFSELVDKMPHAGQFLK